MSDEKHSVETEIDDHKTDLGQWKDAVNLLKIPASHVRVTDRFKRDCQTLITDLDSDETLSAADLCDFVDRKNSLEIQYHNITQDLG